MGAIVAGLREWWRERRLRRLEIDEALWQDAIARYPFTRVLAPDERARLKRWVLLFLDTKSIVGAAGLVLDARMKLAIAVQACLPILELDIALYDDWDSVIVYPDAFRPGHTWTDAAGVVHTDPGARSGEAWSHGPVILSWADVARGGRADGANVVIHEFAHKLDMRNGGADGFPPLRRGMRRQDWAKALGDAYENFTWRVNRRREYTDIDPYAATAPGEFFAVTSEVFFETPEVLMRDYPQVYAQYRQFYGQDPLARLQRAGPLALAS
ncbi:MAG: zinc-dependent peptidase [Burkholderiales bacterium]|nr:zinc-dependent peptidase [Burkholderiales bacterium]